MRTFFLGTARRLTVIWLSPAGIFFALLSLGTWHYGPQIASRAMTVLDGANGALGTVNRPQGGTLARVDAAAGAATGAINSVRAVAVQAKTTIADVGGAAKKTTSQAGNAVQSISNALTRPCKGPAGPDACGTLAATNKVLVKVGNTIVETQMEERGVVPHTTAAMDAMRDAANDLGGFVQAPCLAGANGCVPYLQRTSGNITALTGSWAEMSADFYDFEHPLVHPAPCKTLKCRIYRYVWTPADAILQGSDAAYRGSLWFRAMPVKVVP